MVFHEITQAAIDHAVNNPRSIDYGLVDAAETRRILDRLYGYEVSPVLWRRVNRGLSAGRVQSPAIRLIVERERERIAFVSAGYWDIELLSATAPAFTATLVAVDGDRGRHRQGLRRQRRGRAPGSWPSTRPGRRRSPTASTTPDVHGSLRRGEAVPIVAQAAVHDVDAAAGGRPQAAAVGVAGDASRPGSVRAWLHHLHAHRQRGAVRRGAAGHARGRRQRVRPAVPVAAAQAVHVEVEERPGSARGDPAHHAVPLAAGRAGRAQQPGAGALPA